MADEITKLSHKIGLPPGTPVYVGEQKIDSIRLSILDYNETRIKEHEPESVTEIFPYRDTNTVSWINIDGLHEVETIEQVGKHFGIHSLVIEDILSPQQRPKLEVFDDYLFVVFKMLRYENGEIDSEQISLILGKQFVLTFQEREGDIFGPLRERIKEGRGRARKSQSDYLAYALMDIVVDNYFLTLESIGEHIEFLEETVLDDPGKPFLESLYFLRRQLIFLRKSTWPLREVVSGLQRGELSFIRKTTIRFIGDLHDHTAQVIETVEVYREMVGSILDVYLSTMSNKMNEVMKVLTIMASIFIPLSFLAGVYGMNFDTSISPLNMPELSSRYGYLIFWVATLLTGGGLVFYFKRKQWL